MSAVQTVELADGKNAAAQFGGKIFQTTKRFHFALSTTQVAPLLNVNADSGALPRRARSRRPSIRSLFDSSAAARRNKRTEARKDEKLSSIVNVFAIWQSAATRKVDDVSEFFAEIDGKKRKRRQTNRHSSVSSSRNTGSSVLVLRSTAKTIVRVSEPSGVVATTGKTCRRSGRR